MAPCISMKDTGHQAKERRPRHPSTSQHIFYFSHLCSVISAEVILFNHFHSESQRLVRFAAYGQEEEEQHDTPVSTRITNCGSC